MAEQKPSVVPALIVHSINGSKQVIQLDATNVTDFVVKQNGKSLMVNSPEARISGVRSISFSMVAEEEITTAMEDTENPIVRSVEKLVHDGQVIIRLQTQNGSILEYNIQGNQITTK